MEELIYTTKAKNNIIVVYKVLPEVNNDMASYGGIKIKIIDNSTKEVKNELQLSIEQGVMLANILNDVSMSCLIDFNDIINGIKLQNKLEEIVLEEKENNDSIDVMFL